jgi:hypothetical protein
MTQIIGPPPENLVRLSRPSTGHHRLRSTTTAVHSCSRSIGQIALQSLPQYSRLLPSLTPAASPLPSCGTLTPPSAALKSP